MAANASTSAPPPPPASDQPDDATPDLADGLGTLGLAGDEGLLYAHLVRAGWAPVTHVGDRAGLSEGRAEAALRALVARGLSTQGRLGGEELVLPASPLQSLEATVRRAQESVDLARSVVRSLEDRYAEARARLESGGLVTVVTGAAARRRTLEDLQRHARRETVWLCRADPLAVTDAENTAELAALARGVHYRALYDGASLRSPGSLAEIRDCVRHGEEARVAPEVPLRLMIADGETAVCPLVAERRDAEPSAAVISSGMLLHALSELFEHEWRRALPLEAALSPGADGGHGPGDEPAGDRPFGWDAATVRLVSLVVTGLTDAAIAGHLGISPRTVQRRLAAAMRSCGATTRLELAFRFGQRSPDVPRPRRP